MTTSKVIQFTAALERECNPRKIRVGRWHGGSRDTENLVVIEAGVVSRLIYITNKSEDPGFWSLNENQLIKLRTSGKDWFVVLLVGKSEDGYLLTSAEVERGTHSWSQNRSDLRRMKGLRYQEALGSADSRTHLLN